MRQAFQFFGALAAAACTAARGAQVAQTLVVTTIAGLHGWPLEKAPSDEPAPCVAVNMAGKIYACSYRGDYSVIWEIDPGKSIRGIGIIDSKGHLQTSDKVTTSIKLVGEKITFTQDGPITKQLDEGPSFVDHFVAPMFATGPVRPIGLAVDGHGTVYVASKPIAVDGSGNLFIAGPVVMRLSADGTLTKLAGFNPGFKDGHGPEAQFASPEGIALDQSGNLLLADTANGAIRSVTPEGDVTTLAGTSGIPAFFQPRGVAARPNGEVLVIEKYSPGIKVARRGSLVSVLGRQSGTSSEAPKIKPGWADGPIATARFAGPVAVAVGPDGAIFIVDSAKFSGHWTIRRIAVGAVPQPMPNEGNAEAPEKPREFRGVVTTVSSNLDGAQTLAVDRSGALYVAIDREGTADPWTATVERIAPDGSRSVRAGTTVDHRRGENNDHRFRTLQAILVDPSGVLYVADPNKDGPLVQVLPNGEVYRSLLRNGADLKPGNSMVLSKSGSMYLSDSYRHIIRKVSPGGDESILAGTDGIAGEMDGQGAAALFRGPGLIAVDSSDTVYVIDGSVIRKITPDGTVRTFAGEWGEAGTVDGPSRQARFSGLAGIAVVLDGTIFVADAETIRCITPQGYVQTIAGKRRPPNEQFAPDSYDGSPVTLAAARLQAPHALVVDAQDRLCFIDGNTIRRLELDRASSR